MKDLAKKTEKDLLDDLQKKREELRDMQLGIKATPHGAIRKALRRDIARVLTELNLRQKA